MRSEVSVKEGDGEKALCRCWQSSNFPYCDGSHRKFNERTGSNVGPLIVLCRPTEKYLHEEPATTAVTHAGPSSPLRSSVADNRPSQTTDTNPPSIVKHQNQAATSTWSGFLTALAVWSIPLLFGLFWKSK